MLYCTVLLNCTVGLSASASASAERKRIKALWPRIEAEMLDDKRGNFNCFRFKCFLYNYNNCVIVINTNCRFFLYI